MKSKLLPILSLSICLSSLSISAQNYTINTVAGNGTSGFSGDAGPATAAQIANSYGVYVNSSGNIYIPDGGNQRVRIVNSGGIINTFAGNGTAGFSGDGGQASAAELSSPSAVTGDASGNIYVADGANERIRLVNPGGVISTIAGNGTAGFSGDGGQASAAELNFPACVAMDASGNIYIADLLNQRIRKIAPSGRISTVAGNGTSGFSGDLGQATAAELANPFGVVVDGSGNIYIADQFNNRIRKVSPAGIITTIVGTGAASYSGDLGPATAATMNRPFAVSLDAAGNLYIADFANDRIRKVDNTGIISTIAGNGVAAFSGDGGPATAASLHGPTGISLDLYDNLYITDQSNDRIRELTINCTMTATISSANGATPCTGKAWVTASSGTPPYKYSWSPGGATTDTAKALCTGNYCCTITDNVGCVDTVCIGVVAGIPEINNASSIKIFPNPTNGIFTISGLTKGITVELYNYLGEKVNSILTENSTAQFNIADKAEGIYLVRILSKDGEVLTQSKIIKTN